MREWEAEITAIDITELYAQVLIEFLTPLEVKYSSCSLKVLMSFKIHRQGSNFHPQNAKYPKIPLLVQKAIAKQKWPKQPILANNIESE